MAKEAELCPVCNDSPVKKGARTCSYDCGYRLRTGEYTNKKAAKAAMRSTPVPTLDETLAAVAPQREINMPAGRTVNDPRNKKRIGLSPIKICVVDIETTALNAGFGRILCAVVKSYDPPGTKIFRGDEYPSWKAGRRSDDFEITAEIMAFLEEQDVLIAHNGVGFDLRFIRTRALAHGLPALNPMKIIDPVLSARRNLSLPSNRLEAIQMHINTSAQKTPLSPAIWARAAMDGDKEAMDLIVEHCVADVDVLEEVAWALRGYIRVIDTLGSFR